MRKIGYFFIILSVTASVIAGFTNVSFALSSFLNTFNTRYGTAATALNTCALCHIPPGQNVNNLNPYANAFLAAGANAGALSAIEGSDSDGDTFTNITEITARTFPGDPNSRPVVADATPPTVQAFVTPATSNSLTVPITTLTATDDNAVTGLMVTQSPTAPAASAPNWSATPPTTFTFPQGTAPGLKDLFAWAKDAAGNVSTSRQATVDLIITLTTFADVPADFSFFNQIEAVAAAGITGGCQADNPQTADNEANFCPDNPITRGQMAVFLETSLGGVPAPCVGMFADVPTTDPFCGFIELLANDGITGGCSAQNFCPDAPVTRGQMAVFIEAALGGVPAPCVGTFADVPLTHPFCGFIELLANDGITGGCNAQNFCPNNPVTRGQMAVFLAAAPNPLLP